MLWGKDLGLTPYPIHGVLAVVSVICDSFLRDARAESADMPLPGRRIWQSHCWNFPSSLLLTLCLQAGLVPGRFSKCKVITSHLLRLTSFLLDFRNPRPKNVSKNQVRSWSRCLAFWQDALLVLKMALLSSTSQGRVCSVCSAWRCLRLPRLHMVSQLQRANAVGWACLWLSSEAWEQLSLWAWETRCNWGEGNL